MNKRYLSSLAVLLHAVFALALTGTAGVPLRAADEKAGAAAEKKAPLQLNVDRKPINRDAPDRVSYAPIVKKTAASVVYVFSSKTVKGRDLSPFLNDPALRRFFEIPGHPGSPGNDDSTRKDGNSRKDGSSRKGRVPETRMPDRTQEGLGSGVVITADGYILTNNHIVDGADEVKVSIGDSNKRHIAKVVGRDAGADLAVLKIETTGLSPATFGDSAQLQVGDVVLAIGNPFGVGQSVSRGIVSALGRGVGIEDFEDFIQTDAAINPGNSGGALLDSQGRLVGINTAILSRSGGFAGVGFAIPINLARGIAEQIVNTGKVERGFLGVRLQDLTDELTAQFQAEKGALISEVEADSPAEKAGLKTGDVITMVNETEIRDGRHVTNTVTQMAPETQVAIGYLRDGKVQTANVKLGRRPAQKVASDDRAGPKDEGVLNGVHIDDISAQVREQMQLPARIKGVVITSIDEDSPSAKQGLREGDVVLELDRRPVTSSEEAVKLSEEIKGPKVMLLIWREGRTHYLVIDESKK
ncbi:MAG: Do family serine endopeptidase [Opitutus sp.]|nr:Do family serine endopeptidase [Opitutus sp.]